MAKKRMVIIGEALAKQGYCRISLRKNIVARIARIPANTVSTTDLDMLKNLGKNLSRVVFGQDAAIKALDAAIKMSRSGLGRDSKPVGSFLIP